MTSAPLRLLMAGLAALGALGIAVALGGRVEPPYVITAIDYHFHDSHPTFPIGPGRDLVVRNAGRNTHNVTIPALDYSQDVQPGAEVVIPDLASRFEVSGRYALVCVIHVDRGMIGELVIALD